MKKADNFDASKWLTENKITTQSRLNEADSRSLDKIEQDLNMIMKSNINNDEKDKKIVSLEKIYRQKGGKKTLAQIATNESRLNEDEGEAPLVITVRVTGKGQGSMRLVNSPSEIRMTSDKNNSQMGSDYYYIGNQKYELGKEVSVYFAVYRHDIKEIQTMYLIPKTAEQFKELVDSKSLSPFQIKNLPSDIRKVPDGNFSFKNGFEKGMKDHRGDFEIV